MSTVYIFMLYRTYYLNQHNLLYLTHHSISLELINSGNKKLPFFTSGLLNTITMISDKPFSLLYFCGYDILFVLIATGSCLLLTVITLQALCCIKIKC